MRSNGQVTLFILVGIVLLFMVGFIIYVTNDVVMSGSDGNTNEQTSTSIEAKRVKFFISGCLGSATKEALRIAGLQSGIFYKSQVDDGAYFFAPPMNQYGDKYIPYAFQGDIYNVSYALWPRGKPNCNSLPSSTSGYSDCPGIDRPLDSGVPGTYPFGGYPSSDVHTLPPLCRINGSNHRLLSGAEFSCGEMYGSGHTVQGYLESYIKQRTLSCIEEGRKEGIFELNVTFADEQNITTTVMFGEEDVASILDMPVRVSLSGDADASFEAFVKRIPIRFKQLYEFADRLLREDAKNIYNNLDKAGEPRHSTLMECHDFIAGDTERDTVVNCYRDGFNVTYITKACNYTADRYGLNLCKDSAKHNSFLILTDNKSTAIGNAPFRIVLAIGNRGPVMDEVSYWGYDSDHYDNATYYWRYLQSNYNTTPSDAYNLTSAPSPPNPQAYDIIADFDSTISIIPYAIDPDEDYDPYGDSGMYSVFHYEGWLVNTTSNVWEDSRGYQDGVPYFSSHQPEKKDANVSMNDTLVGDHTVTVFTEDKPGNRVSQDIAIQVRCRDRRRGHEYGVLEYFEGTQYSGDYNYSNPVVPDVNNMNDCCNESGGYVWNEEGHKCGPCRRCNETGDCGVNVSAGNNATSDPYPPDCPVCYSCNASSTDYKTYSDACKINNSINPAVDNRCHSQYGGNGMCCEGTCFNSNVPADLDEFSYSIADANSNNQTYPECWNQTPTCVTPDTPGIGDYPELVGNYTYRPLDNGSTSTDPVTGNPCLCGNNGRC